MDYLSQQKAGASRRPAFWLLGGLSSQDLLDQLCLGDVADAELFADLAQGVHFQGVQTVLERYVAKNAYQCPADKGDGNNDTPIFTRRGSSYNIAGFPWAGPTDPDPVRAKRSMRMTLNYNRDIGGDLFKSWDVEDPTTVATKVAAGEFRPVKWHKKFYNMLLGDGHVMSFPSKSEYQDAEKGYVGSN